MAFLPSVSVSGRWGTTLWCGPRILVREPRPWTKVWYLRSIHSSHKLAFIPNWNELPLKCFAIRPLNSGCKIHLLCEWALLGCPHQRGIGNEWTMDTHLNGSSFAHFVSGVNGPYLLFCPGKVPEFWTRIRDDQIQAWVHCWCWSVQSLCVINASLFENLGGLMVSVWYRLVFWLIRSCFVSHSQISPLHRTILIVPLMLCVCINPTHSLFVWNQCLTESSGGSMFGAQSRNKCNKWWNLWLQGGQLNLNRWNWERSGRLFLSSLHQQSSIQITSNLFDTASRSAKPGSPTASLSYSKKLRHGFFVQFQFNKSWKFAQKEKN